MKYTTSAIVSTFLASVSVQAAAGVWEQCGAGRCAWTGTTTCVSGTQCVAIDHNYAQCRPLDATPVPAVGRYFWSTQVEKAGPNFVIDCKPFKVVGANAPTMALSGLSNSEIDAKLDSIAAAKGTVVRVWGFNEVVKASSGNYIQSWNDGTSTKPSVPSFNPAGLAGLDRVVSSAEARGLRVIIVLTNNWSEYGGMDVYVDRVVGPNQPHDLFYTNPRIVSIFSGYANRIVNRYIYRAGIFGYELANEPRCAGSNGLTSGTCTPATITAWATKLSAAIKSYDPFALVAIGDEGFYNEQGPTQPYEGAKMGIDFDANLAISSIDYGTFTTYPNRWGQASDASSWGATWIEEHAESSKVNAKPVILEAVDGSSADQSAWKSAVESSGLTGGLLL